MFRNYFPLKKLDFLLPKDAFVKFGWYFEKCDMDNKNDDDDNDDDDNDDKDEGQGKNFDQKSLFEPSAQVS